MFSNCWTINTTFFPDKPIQTIEKSFGLHAWNLFCNHGVDWARKPRNFYITNSIIDSQNVRILMQVTNTNTSQQKNPLHLSTKFDRLIDNFAIMEKTKSE